MLTELTASHQSYHVDGSGTPGYPKPWLSEKILGHRFFRNIVLSWMRCFGGFVSSRRYHPDQKNEIYNLGVVPDLQIHKKVEFLMIYMYFFEIYFCIFFGIFFRDKDSMQIGSGGSGGGWDWLKMISWIVGTFWDGFWPTIHWKNNENQCFSMFFRWFSMVFPDNQGFG